MHLGMVVSTLITNNVTVLQKLIITPHTSSDSQMKHNM